MGSAETNTTALISAWSMDGARSDLGGRFGSVVDIEALVAERARQRAAVAEPATAPSPLLVKTSEDDDWRPLPLEREVA